MATTYHIGTSGWHYDHWRQVFYPADVPKSKWLEFYSRRFSTVEVNNTFYRLPSEEALGQWREAVSPGFVFALKVSRFVTHVKRLRSASEPMGKFAARARLLGDRLGPLLYQLPPNMKRDERTLEEFLVALPEGLQHVFEFRDSSWFDERVFKLLRRHGAGFCIYDMPGVTTPVVATADFAYIRFHGRQWLYGGSYSDEELAEWAQRFRDLNVSTVYAYFNNDAEGFAIRNAITLRRLLEAPEQR